MNDIKINRNIGTYLSDIFYKTKSLTIKPYYLL